MRVRKKERGVQGWTWQQKEGVVTIVSCGRLSKLRCRVGDSTVQRPFGPNQGREDKAWISVGRPEDTGHVGERKADQQPEQWIWGQNRDQPSTFTTQRWSEQIRPKGI